MSTDGVSRQAPRKYPRRSHNPPKTERTSSSEAPVKSWDQAVYRFIDQRRGDNISGATLKNYGSYLLGMRMEQFRADRDIKVPADFSASKLETLKQDLAEVDLAPQTIATQVRITKNFLNYCIQEGFGPDGRVLRVKQPRLAQVEPEVWTLDEEKRILAHLRGRGRDEFLVQFMLNSGVRLAEVARIELRDIDLDNPLGPSVRVRGKGGKDRIAPLGWRDTAFGQRVKRYVSKERPQTAQPALFVTKVRDTRTRDYRPLSREAIQLFWRRLHEEKGMTDIAMNPHKTRHTFATRCLVAPPNGPGVDSLLLMRALGHTTLTMVNRYVHFQTDDLLRAARRA